MTKDTFVHGQKRPYDAPDVREIAVSPMSLVCGSPGDAPGLDGETDFGLFSVPDLPNLPNLPF